MESLKSGINKNEQFRDAIVTNSKPLNKIHHFSLLKNSPSSPDELVFPQPMISQVQGMSYRRGEVCTIAPRVPYTNHDEWNTSTAAHSPLIRDFIFLPRPSQLKGMNKGWHCIFIYI